MSIKRNALPSVNQRVQYYLVIALVSGFFAAGSVGVVWWIVYQLRDIELAKQPVKSPVYVNYNTDGPYTQTKDWSAAQSGYQQYVKEHPQPQNIQVLKGWSTAQIYSYMVTQVSGGLKVSCQYCHVINEANGWNFAAEGNPNKVKARQMMIMASDLNRNFITKLPASVGNKQITCATCHNGKPVFATYPASIQVTQPDNYQLPLDLQYPGGLVVTGRRDKSLPDVALNQYTMYHMNISLGQGCTFCHNSRHFPSYEINNKYYAGTMMLMAQHLLKDGYPYTGDSSYNNPDAPKGSATPDQNFVGVMAGQNYNTIMNKKVPSCWMCHQGAQLPPGAANDKQVPPQLSSNPPAQ